MTLLDHLPTLRHAAAQRIDADAWPRTTSVDDLGQLCVGGVALPDLAAEFGTPVHVVDEADLRHRLRRCHVGAKGILPIVAGTSLPTTVLRWVDDEGLGLALRCGRELATARTAGVTPARMVLHVAGLPHAELAACVEAAPGRIVVASPIDAAYLGGVAREGQRVLVGADGAGPDPGTLERVLRNPRLDLVGLHCHAADDVAPAIRTLLASMTEVRSRHGVLLTEINLTVEAGGTEAAESIDDALDEMCAAFRFPRPRVVVENRCSLVRLAGVTVYRVASIVTPPRGPRVVVVDDRVTGAGHGPVALANRHPLSVDERVTIAGAGATHAHDVELPCDVHPGDVLAVAAGTTGDGAVVAVRNGLADIMIHRASLDDALARDAGFCSGRGGHDQDRGGYHPDGHPLSGAEGTRL